MAIAFHATCARCKHPVSMSIVLPFSYSTRCRNMAAFYLSYPLSSPCHLFGPYFLAPAV